MATVNFDAPTTGWVEIEATDAAIRQAFVSVGSDAAVRVQVGT